MPILDLWKSTASTGQSMGTIKKTVGAMENKNMVENKVCFLLF